MPDGTADLVQIAVWPLCVLLIAALFILIFRSSIAGLINRAQKVGVAGGSVEAAPTPHQETKVEVRERQAEQIESATAEMTRTGIPLHAGYATETFQRAEKDVPDVKERLRFLSNLVVAEARWKQYEIIYRQIFGSQIDLLDALN